MCSYWPTALPAAAGTAVELAGAGAELAGAGAVAGSAGNGSTGVESVGRRTSWPRLNSSLATW
jgi:hypothetical protein